MRSQSRSTSVDLVYEQAFVMHAPLVTIRRCMQAALCCTQLSSQLNDGYADSAALWMSAVQKTINAVSPSVELAKKKYIEAHDVIVVSCMCCCVEVSCFTLHAVLFMLCAQVVAVTFSHIMP